MTLPKWPLLVLVLAGTACTVAPTQPVDPYQLELQQARKLLRQGNFSTAARLYQRLAKTAKSEQRNRFALLAAQAWLDNGDAREAQQVLDALDPAALIAEQRDRLYLLRAECQLANAQAQAALLDLQQIHAIALPDALNKRYHTLRAYAFAELGDALESARERVALAPYLSDDYAASADNDRQILQQLSQLSVEQLNMLSPPAPDVLGGWLQLALAFRQPASGMTALESRIARWRMEYPGHPADSSDLLQDLVEAYQQAQRPPATIAVILPESGAYKSAAAAIRSGLISGYYAQGSDQAKPALQFYDSGDAHPYDLVQQAVAQGAEFIIGPLDKKKLEKLAQSSASMPVPVLALNQLPDSSLLPEQLYQFSLKPEDEVEQVADSAWFDGHQRALILAPASALGRRLASHFAQHWVKQGGEVMDTQMYNTKESDYRKPLQRLLQLHKDANATAGWQSASDADVIFLVAHPRAARLIGPQLAFYGVHLPVYATSHVFHRRGDMTRDRDLSGMVFCDIPWLVESDSVFLSALQPPAAYLRLTAFGVDAYALVSRLGTLLDQDDARYDGATGTLSFEGRTVQRQLHCAQFRNGMPRYRGLAPVLVPAYAGQHDG